MSIVLAVLAPAAAIIVSGRFAAPRSPRRLPADRRVPLELGVFALAAAAYAGGRHALAVTFAAVAVVNAVLLTVLRQREA